MKTSGILTWNKENINETPSLKGIFVLRTSPINGFIQILDETENLKETLENIYNNQSYQGVRFFEWYQSDNQEETREKIKELKLKYNFESDGHSE